MNERERPSRPTPSNAEPARARRPQQNLAAPTRKRGIPAVADVLWNALNNAHLSSLGERVDDVTHGFHSWPAGMPPAIARTILDAFAGPADSVVVDPFSGGGTVGLEALLHRRAFVGVDLNPLAARVGFQRCRPRTDDNAEAVEAVVDAVTERSKDRVRTKRRVRADVSPEIASAFLPHTLVELAGLLEEIGAVDDDDARTLMAVVFSSILTKVSLKRGDTDTQGNPSKRVARFFPSEVFQEKAHNLLDRQRALFRRIGQDVPRPQFVVDDARNLPTVVPRAKLILTSPPYGGTYDYVRHHALRLAFLQLDASKLEEMELGARRKKQTVAEFDDDVAAMLGAMSKVLDRDGLAVLLMGDAVVDGRLLSAGDQLAFIGPKVGLDVVASAAAPRIDWHAGGAAGPAGPGARGPGRSGPERLEHLVALRRHDAR